MEKLMNKKVLIIVLVAIVVIAFFSFTGEKSEVRENEAQMNQIATTTVSTTTVKTPAPVVKKAVAPVTSQPVSLSYQQALELYKDNKRIQLSGTDFCQASPNNVMYKNGTSIMIDNRSSNTRNIKVGTASYTIEGYGFKIIKLSSSTLPATLLMDCGTQQNIAKILLQR